MIHEPDPAGREGQNSILPSLIALIKSQIRGVNCQTKTHWISDRCKRKDAFSIASPVLSHAASRRVAKDWNTALSKTLYHRVASRRFGGRGHQFFR